MSNRDSIDRLIDYTQTIKPYHTKIYEVLTNYTYFEGTIASFTDKFEAIPVPCVCDPNEIYIGWDAQPYSEHESKRLDATDPRGNFLYEVIDNIENVYWGFPLIPPVVGPGDECCVDCDLMLCENVGWDTQPYGLYETANGAEHHVENPNNVEWDSPQVCPDVGT